MAAKLDPFYSDRIGHAVDKSFLHRTKLQVRLPPYCAPIEELAEGPPTPKKKPLLLEAHPAAHAHGPPEPPEPPVSLLPPRKSDLQSQSTASIATSGSEVTLMEESLGAYCEPFGKALMPPTMNDDVIADDSVASNGFKSSTPMRSNGEQQGRYSVLS